MSAEAAFELAKNPGGDLTAVAGRATPVAEGPSRVRLLDCEIDAVDMTEALVRCQGFIDSRQFAQHMSLNAAKVVALHEDQRLREIVAGSQLVTADGLSVVWASRLLGAPLPERVAGIDLMYRLMGLAEQNGYSVFFLGARADVLQRAIAQARIMYPALKIAGYRDGYFDQSRDRAIASEVREHCPDIVFVGMSSPRKEYFLADQGRNLDACFVMGVGGAIDVLAGVTRRAPRWMQRLGLEWLFRLLQEPRRLIRRYIVTNSRFVLLVGRSLVTHRGPRRRVRI